MYSLKEIEDLAEQRTKNRILCKVCGHSRLLGRKDRIICNYCGNWIFKDEATEFSYRLKENMLKEKRNRK